MRTMRVLLPLLFAATLSAQVRETTFVEVVQVPVYVTNAAGESLEGLTKEDFVLTVNGKPQAIDYFDVVDFAKLTREAARDPRQRRLYVLVFDLVYSSPNGIARAQRAAERYLENAREADLFSVATYTSNRGLQLSVPFTRDREMVREAVHRLRETNTSDPLRLTRAAVEGEPGRPDQFGERELATRDAGSVTMQEMLVDPMRRLYGDQVDDLADLATRLTPIEGNRHVVLISGGHDNSIVSGVATSVMPRSGVRFVSSGTQGTAALGTAADFENRPTLGEPLLLRKIREMRSAFTTAGVFLDAIDINGVPGPFERALNESLFTLSHDTGGSVVYNRNDLREAMEVLAERQRVAYTLGFHAPNTHRETNSIRVSLRNHSGAELNYRPSYSTTLPKASATDGLRLADILLNDLPQNGLTVKATATAQEGKTVVDVEIPSRELIAVSESAKFGGEVLLYVFKDDSVVAFQQKAIDVDAVRASTSLKGAPVHFSQTFDLPPGKYTAKVLVRLQGSDALGFARSEFEAARQ